MSNTLGTLFIEGETNVCACVNLNLHDACARLSEELYNTVLALVKPVLKRNIMSTASGRPPQLPLKAITAIICRYFDFEEVYADSIKEFPSYDDRNYYFRGESLNAKGCEYVLKLSNPLNINLDEAIGLNSIMKHLSSCGFLTPYPQLSKSGSDAIQLTGAELKVISEDYNKCSLETLSELKVAKSNSGSHEVGDGTGTITNGSFYSGKEESKSNFVYVIRVFSFIPGQLFDDVEKRFLTPGLVYTTGEMLGRLDKELVSSSNGGEGGMEGGWRGDGGGGWRGAIQRRRKSISHSILLHLHRRIFQMKLLNYDIIHGI